VALGTAAWFSAFGEAAELIRSSDFDTIQERRLRLQDGLVVEVAIGAPEWASTEPVDHGTARVVGDGFVPLYDPRGVLTALLNAVSRA